eukprot:9322127-Pyramimonas_sp.AAC.1
MSLCVPGKATDGAALPSSSPGWGLPRRPWSPRLDAPRNSGLKSGVSPYRGILGEKCKKDYNIFQNLLLERDGPDLILVRTHLGRCPGSSGMGVSFVGEALEYAGTR